MTEKPIVDGELEDEAPERPAEGFGRRTVARRRPLELFADLADAAAPAARVFGAERAADVAEKTARVAREAPRALENVERETRPLRTALKNLYDSAEKAGIVHRRPPAEPRGRKTTTEIRCGRCGESMGALREKGRVRCPGCGLEGVVTIKGVSR
jgi:DNA-directed RNA polymerase subunit RPC12/RpoP